MVDQRKSTCGAMNRRRHYGGSVRLQILPRRHSLESPPRRPHKHVRGISVCLPAPVTSGEHGRQLSTPFIPLILSFLELSPVINLFIFGGYVCGVTRRDSP